MFGRQWFPNGSQTGLTSDAIQFEFALQACDLGTARQILCSSYNRVSEEYWMRMGHRLQWLRKRSLYARNNKIRYFFYGFWPELDINHCQVLDFFKMADTAFHWEAVEDPSRADIVFSSCYANDYHSIHTHSKQALQVLFLGENVRPFYSLYDMSLSFDQDSYCGRNIYLPLWMFELNWFGYSRYPDRRTYQLESFTKTREINIESRKAAVCYIGNNNEPLRMSIISTLLDMNIAVDCYGSQNNPVKDKIETLAAYKYTLCLENSYYPGYTTEKPVHAYLAGTKAIYWGGVDPLLNIDGNPAFILLRPGQDLRTQICDIANDINNTTLLISERLFTDADIRVRFDLVLEKISRALNQFRN